MGKGGLKKEIISPCRIMKMYQKQMITSGLTQTFEVSKHTCKIMEDYYEIDYGGM